MEIKYQYQEKGKETMLNYTWIFIVWSEDILNFLKYLVDWWYLIMGYKS